MFSFCFVLFISVKKMKELICRQIRHVIYFCKRHPWNLLGWNSVLAANDWWCIRNYSWYWPVADTRQDKNCSHHKNNIIYLKKLNLAQKLRLDTEKSLVGVCETNITHLMVNDDVWITTNWAGVPTYLVASLETEVRWLFINLNISDLWLKQQQQKTETLQCKSCGSSEGGCLLCGSSCS